MGLPYYYRIFMNKFILYTKELNAIRIKFNLARRFFNIKQLRFDSHRIYIISWYVNSFIFNLYVFQEYKKQRRKKIEQLISFALSLPLHNHFYKPMLRMSP